MTGSSAKIVLAVGITSLLTAIVLIAVFAGFLYFRGESGRGVSVSSPEKSRGPAPSVTPRIKSTNGPTAADITMIKFSMSSMSSNPAKNVAGMFGNINVQNFTSSSKVLIFSADGTASKDTVTETLENGKTVRRSERFAASITQSDFSRLAGIFAENDFVNEPDSKNITSLPIKNVLTITYRDGSKIINTGHTGVDSPETTAMLNAIKELEQKIAWKSAQ